MSVAKENFNPVEFLVQVHSNSRLDALQNGLQKLHSMLQDRHTQLRALVREHFSQYVHCKDTIDLIHMLLAAELVQNSSTVCAQQMRGRGREGKGKQVSDLLSLCPLILLSNYRVAPPASKRCWTV